MNTRVAALNRASIRKRFDAYADVPWDEPGFAVDVEDPRWERGPSDPLGATEWYQSLPSPERAKLGLELTMAQLRLGIDFESVLSRGLLELAGTLDVRDEAFRYAYHEVIEEAQHSLMFRELIVRSGLSPRGLTGLDRWGSHFVPSLARKFPELFFVFVLGGEAPIDHVQRNLLRSSETLPPVLARVVRIHVTEEARHLKFAELFLRERAPRLGVLAKAHLALRAPFILGVMADQMLRLPKEIVRAHRIPRAVLKEAYGRELRIEKARSLDRLRELFSELGLIRPYTRWLWRSFGIDGASSPLPLPRVAG